MAKRTFTCPGPVSSPLPPTRFRDIVYMWFYATMTCYDDVSKGTAKSADLMACLQGKLDPKYQAQNSFILGEICDAVVKDAQNLNNIPNVNSAIRDVVKSEQPWPGQHPGVNELDSILVSPALLATRARGKTKKAAGQEKK